MRPIRIPRFPHLVHSKGTGNILLLSRARARSSDPDWTNLGGDILTAHELILVLPLPPSINQQYATVNGRRVLSSKGRQYKLAVGKHLSAIVQQSPHRADFYEELGTTQALSLSIRFYFKTALRRDLDGGLKIAQDAICQGITLNDNRITEIHLHKDIDATRPRIECTLALLPPLPPQSTTRRRTATIKNTPRSPDN